MADVLVVDDDQDMAITVEEILRSDGNVVRLAADGQHGLDLLEERLPDVIVLDVEMPRLTGPEMANRMLILDAGRERIPIVLMSGVADLARIAALVGTPYVLTKPCALATFVDTVRRALTERTAPSPDTRPVWDGAGLGEELGLR